MKQQKFESTLVSKKPKIATKRRAKKRRTVKEDLASNSLNIPVAGRWKKANLIALVNGAPAMTALSVTDLVLYENSILEYKLPVRDCSDFTILYTDLRCWLVQPDEN